MSEKDRAPLWPPHTRPRGPPPLQPRQLPGNPLRLPLPCHPGSTKRPIDDASDSGGEPSSPAAKHPSATILLSNPRFLTTPAPASIPGGKPSSLRMSLQLLPRGLNMSKLLFRET
ncbi:hypothetical protein GWK47_040803 [Chionoecetes opilio]|uniref:Uncharacterized protein n=1 Tax=Chionoecetes opilio TaxID=41210 RepID=A0A8J4YAE7_CHIOP|nr:hypothetical protein GWK47_040803 [Chionoecetes opilio]